MLDPESQLEAGYTARASLHAGTRMAAATRSGALAALPRLTLNCEVAGEQFVVRSDGDGSGSVRHGLAEDPDADLRCDLPRWFRMISRGEPLHEDIDGESSAIPAAALLDVLAEEPAPGRDVKSV